MPVSLIALFLVGWSFLGGSVGQPTPDSYTTVHIVSCFALRHELGRPSGNETLVLAQSLHCDANEWSSPVTVMQDKILQGQLGEDVLTLDLSKLDKDSGIIVNPDTHLTLDHLVLPNRPEDEEQQFSLSYIRHSSDATINIARSFIIYTDCKHVRQKSASLMTKSKQNPYHVCGTRELCREQISRNRKYTIDKEMKDSCLPGNGLTEEVFQDDEARDQQKRPINSLAVLIALLALLSGFLVMGGIIVWMCRSKESSARVLDTFFHQDEKSITASETTEADFSMSLRLVAFEDFSIDLDQQLGVGGFGTVFAGRFQVTPVFLFPYSLCCYPQNQRAAVKVIKSADVPDGHEASEEANLSIGLSHPNVIRCYATRQVKMKDLFGEQHPQGKALTSIRCPK